MFSAWKKVTQNLIRKSTYVRQEPINKASLIILIFIDIFVLINVFSGLAAISQWPLSPAEEFPCFSAYENYRTAENKETFTLNVTTIETLIQQHQLSPAPVIPSRRLGQVSRLCNNHTRLSKATNIPELVKLKASIDQLTNEIAALNQEIKTLQSQYDSTLLEKIAGQAREKSINPVNADQIKSKIEFNKQQITQKKQQIRNQETQLIQHPAASAYLKLLNQTSDYETLKKAYQASEFWYPNQQLLLQTLFLLPLIAIAYSCHTAATRKNAGLQALLSWHLLVIFCIPLLIKLFEFLQFGNLVATVIEWIVNLLGGLIFIASYVLILIIPLLGWGLIKLLQAWVFNTQVQAKKRIQKIRCIHCNAQLRLTDEFCPYCGFEQYIDCSNCHHKAYKFTNFCSTCGHQLENH